MIPLLLLRPEPGLSRSIARAEALGLTPIACPLFVIEPMTWTPPPPGDFDALLLTSANAVEQAGPGLQTLRSLPVHAVGAATAEAARAAGLTVSSVGREGIEQLLSGIAPGQRLLHLAGAHRTAPPVGGHHLTNLSVYRARIVDTAVLPPLGRTVIAVHSPRAGRRLDALARDRNEATIVAISDAAAAACGEGWGKIAVAEAPHDAALLVLAARLCQSAASP